jgi:uncharacterized phage protein (TIGR01671 family)
MRTIKFRGKRKDNGEWVYGYYLYRKWNRRGWGEYHYIVREIYPADKETGKVFPENFGTLVDVVEVDPATVGQFTGLLDSKGKEIYEGDIATHLKFGSDEQIKGEVIIEISRGVCIGYWPASKNIEVIGNIHENPELLGEKK